MSVKQTQQIGRYHVMDRIAYGGMAEIFRAKTYDPDRNERVVVIKKVLAHLAEDDEFIDMLVDEAKIAGTLEHPNIAQVFEFGQVEDGYFIAMEYVDGKDVRSLLDKCRGERRRLSVENCVYIMSQALRGLFAAHTAKDAEGKSYSIVHRDVSPSNILCGYNGEVKLIDFGIAKARMSRVRTKTGVIKGKVKYMSPEQAMGKELDPRSDVFSAGSVLYEMLTKVPPFQAPSEMDLIFRVREAEYTPPSKRNPRVPKELEKILGRAMARSRSRRYRTSAEFADDLTAFLYAIRPDYEPSEIARFLKRLYADEIERELRALEEYVVGDASRQNVGVNLIADALPKNAPYQSFSPVPGPHEAGTVLFESGSGDDAAPPQTDGEPGSGSPDDRSIHIRPTMILKPEDLERMRPSKKTIHEERTLYLDRAAAGLPPEEAPPEDADMMKTLSPPPPGAAKPLPAPATAKPLPEGALFKYPAPPMPGVPSLPVVPRGSSALRGAARAPGVPGPPLAAPVPAPAPVRAPSPAVGLQARATLLGAPLAGARRGAQGGELSEAELAVKTLLDPVVEEDETPTTPRQAHEVVGALFGLRRGAPPVREPTSSRSSPGPGQAEPQPVRRSLLGNKPLPGPSVPAEKPRVRLVTPVISLDDGLLEELEVTDSGDPSSPSLQLDDDDLLEVPPEGDEE